MLIFGLSLLSWIATYSGMLELITANAGQIGALAMVAIGFAVAMLQLMILYVLDQLFSREFYSTKRAFAVFPLYIVGYLLLTLISVGFGFGFYWKHLEARSESTLSAESSIGQVQSLLQTGQSQLEQLQSTFATLSAISTKRAETERSVGGTCPGSRPGEGPRMRLREADARKFAFAEQFVSGRVDAVKAEIAALNAKLAMVLSNDPSTRDPKTGTRNLFLRKLNSELALAITRFNALRADPQLLALRDDFTQRAAQTRFPDGRGGSFRCPDPALSAALNGVVRAINALPTMQTPKIAAVEGSAAVIEAFRRLTTTLFGVLRLELPPTPDELRAARERARSGGDSSSGSGAVALEAHQAGLGPRDYIPLTIAIFVDFCILLVSINRPLNRFRNLFGGVEEARDPRMSELMTIFYQVFEDEFHGRPAPDDVYNPIQDAIFDHRGTYYAAVPLTFGKKSFEEGEGPASEEEQRRLLSRSRYIANVFFALENHGFVSLVRFSSRLTRYAREQLGKQGSEFAAARSFRLYRFRSGKWPEIVLRSVISAHQAHRENVMAQQAIAHSHAAPAPQREQYRGEAVAKAKGPVEQIGHEERKSIAHMPEEPKERASGSGTGAAQDVGPGPEPGEDDVNQDVPGEDEFSGLKFPHEGDGASHSGNGADPEEEEREKDVGSGDKPGGDG